MASLLENLEAVGELLIEPPFGLITDVDGTISPIAPTPQQAIITAPCRRYLTRLARQVALVALVSGRPAAEIHAMAGIKTAVYIGNHGMERWQAGQVEATAGGAGRYTGIMNDLAGILARGLPINGLNIENKGLSLSVHYRLTADPSAAKNGILNILDNIPEAAGLRIQPGKKVIDILPPLAKSKGTAVADLVQLHRLRVAVYLGDDTTDIDAFQAIRSLSANGEFRGLAIAVTHPEMPDNLTGEADYCLNGVNEVETFLKWLSRSAS
jgi:trehalose 6-phosphate phosphatase